MTTCTNWRLVTPETDLHKLINYCLRKVLPSFNENLKKWDYYTLRKIEGQMALVERVGDNCQPFKDAAIIPIAVVNILGWEYCSNMIIQELRDTE
jgi:hypothetical protein